MTTTTHTAGHSTLHNPPDELTVRDKFAVSALTGVMAHWYVKGHFSEHTDYVAKAYAIADAMLAERKKQPQRNKVSQHKRINLKK